MTRLLIIVEVDVDPALEDPHEVGQDILVTDNQSGRAVSYAGNPVEFVSAEWLS